MTKTAKIAVLGAGIMGLSATTELAQHGHKITLFDPAGLPPETNASALAGGMLAPYSEIEHMPGHWINAGLQGIEYWKSFGRTHNTGFQQNGSLLLAHTEDRYILERFRAHLPADIYQNINPPQNLTKFETAIYLPAEAHLNPQQTLRTLSNISKITFMRMNAEPDNIAADYDLVIDCRGIAAKDSNLRGVKGEIALVRNTEFTLEKPLRLMHPRYPLYIVPRDENIFMIGATQIESDSDETVSLRSTMELLSALYSLHPSFGDAEIIGIKAGIRPAYPDNLPRMTIRANVISCNGLFRHGYLLAPVIAACIKDYSEGKEHEFFNLFTGSQHENSNQRPGKRLRSAA